MKHTRYLLYFLTIFSVYGTTIAGNDSTAVIQSAGPQMVFEEESFDFGTIEPGQVVDHVFHFRNVGQDTLYIKDVSSG